MVTRWLYLHGLGSGPESAKGLAFAAHLARRGVHVERLNLRVPSFRELRLSAMIEVVRAAIGGPDDRAVVLGSSLGGLTAARAAAADPRIRGLVLFAPAFGFGDWRARNPVHARAWERKGWLGMTDHTTGELVPVGVGFLHDVESFGPDVPPADVPTLVVHGRQDEVVPIAGSRAWVPRCRDARLVEVDDGHELRESIPRLLDESDRFFAAQGWIGA